MHNYFPHTQEDIDLMLEKVGVGPAYKEVVSAFDKLLSEHGYRREETYYRVEEPWCSLRISG